MPVARREAEPAGRLAREVDADEDGRLVADDPRVVAWLDDQGRRRREGERAAVRVLALHPPAGEEADMRVVAEIGADDRLDVRRPAVSDRVDDALDARRRGRDGVHD